MSSIAQSTHSPVVTPQRVHSVETSPIIGDDDRLAQANLPQAPRDVEPWLPVETKLVVWSIGIGVALLIVLTVVNRLFPASL